MRTWVKAGLSAGLALLLNDAALAVECPHVIYDGHCFEKLPAEEYCLEPIDEVDDSAMVCLQPEAAGSAPILVPVSEVTGLEAQAPRKKQATRSSRTKQTAQDKN